MTDFKLIESKWQEYWAADGSLWRAKDFSKKSKVYILNEFPYPSGSGLHVGHAFSFVGGDVYARFKRMQGYNVLFPMGWDAFGLPTENYAIKMKRKPQDITRENTDMFRKQMKRLALSYDWEREINTTDPAYYKWTQWIFIQLFKKGLVYKKEMPINWCPSCKIGLANEEVVDGKCERCGAEVSRRNISQWVVKITEYADKLIDGLKETNFIDKVKQSQINWIGKSEGAHIKFSIFNFQFSNDKKNYLEVFTTRPDTLFGATFMVIAPEHPLVGEILARDEFLSSSHPSPEASAACGRKNSSLRQDVETYVKNARKKSEMERTEISKEKTGVFSGLYAINPVNNKQIPIWISDFVLSSYGTGAIMSVPAHDERDFAFAKKFGLEIISVYDEKTDRVINSDFINGLDKEKAFKKMINWLEENKVGERNASYHLRDWIFSRQHYWGEPIPMIHCSKCSMNHNFQFSIFNFQSNSNDKGFNEMQDKLKNYVKKTGIDIKVLEDNPGWYPAGDDQLPIVLPEVEAYEPTDDGKSPLSKIKSFVKCKCPVCGEEAERETDTMPNWAGSDWYYLAYCMATKINNQLPINKKQTITNNQKTNNKNEANDVFNDIFSDSKKELEYWGPVDVYIGGDEHNVLHLLYSRFVYQFLWDLGVIPKETKEPYYKRISHGVILGPDGQRMSKSKGNVIVPEVVADKYGVDVVRMYLMFMGPFDSTMAWNENTLMGVKRFLDKFFKFINNQLPITNNQNKTEIASSKQVKLIINKLIKRVGEDLENFKYNTAIAKMMEAINSLSAIQSVSLSEEDIKILIKLLAPMAPYMAEEMWSRLHQGFGEPRSVHLAQWPIVDKKYLVEETVVIAVAVNGKVRGQLTINNEDLIISNKDTIINKAKDLEQIKKWIGEGKIVKEIYIPNKMINLVIQ